MNGLRITKRLAAGCLLLALAGLLCGCASQIEEREMMDVSQLPIQPAMRAPLEDAYADQTQLALLYFLSEDGTRLVPVSRQISIAGGVSRARAALDALLAGPQEGEEGTWPQEGISSLGHGLQVSSGVATVNLPARVRTLPQRTLYAMRLAITNTLTEFSEISYVNVLIGGREEGFDLGATMPVGTLSRVGDLDAAGRYDRLDDQRQSASGFDQTTTLYFPTPDGRYLLPQVRSVQYAETSPIEYLYTLLEELGGGANGTLAHAGVPAPMLFLNEMPEIVRTDDGAYRAIEIRFKASLDEALADAGLTRGVYMAMLTYTLMGAVPGVEGLQVFIGEEQITGLSAEHTPDGQGIEFSHVLATYGDFEAYAGAPVTVYIRNEAVGGLSAVRRVLHYARQGDPHAQLELLMQPENGVYTLPQGLTTADVLAVSVEGDRIAVNLSAAFAGALKNLSDANARAAVYAMVNTLTEQARGGSVTFFFGGGQLETPLGGVEMRGELMRNPGMVVD